VLLETTMQRNLNRELWVMLVLVCVYCLWWITTSADIDINTGIGIGTGTGIGTGLHAPTAVSPLKSPQLEPPNNNHCSKLRQRRRRPKALEHLRVYNKSTEPNEESTQQVRVLCFLVTHSGHHETRVRAIRETWGPKCDKLIVSSNRTDPGIGAIQISNTSATYDNLWLRLQETILYIHKTYYNSHRDGDDDGYYHYNYYDWFLKVDDDCLVIMENLKRYLASKQHSKLEQPPRILGRLFSWANPNKANKATTRRPLEVRDDSVRSPLHWTCEFQDMVDYLQLLKKKKNTTTPQEGPSYEIPSRWMYNSGGAGYVMNRAYLDELVSVLQTHRLDYKVPEDLALGATMWLTRGILPFQEEQEFNTTFLFHPELPQHMYHLPKKVYSYLADYHYPPGSLKSGSDCCDTYSVTFHHATPKHMRYIYDMLYAKEPSDSC
jgi:glycoprotein-N-acetylgalactosamine 3-beta-galactosyltransferase